MKKILFLILTSFLVLAACGNDEESKLDDTKETKSEDKESKKDDKESDEEKDKSDEKQKSDDKSSEEVATQDESTEEAQSQEKVNTQEQQSTQQPVQSQQQTQQAPTLQEKANANAKVAKEHGYTGIPNGDAMSDVPVGQIELPPEELAKEEAKPEYQDVVETEEEADKRIGE